MSLTLQVTQKGDLYNMYLDTEGEQQRSLVGNMKDLRSIKVKEIAGIPIEKLQAQYEIQRDRAGKRDGGMPDRIVGFPDTTPVPLPPGTVKVYKVLSAACMLSLLWCSSLHRCVFALQWVGTCHLWSGQSLQRACVPSTQYWSLPERLSQEHVAYECHLFAQHFCCINVETKL